MLIRLATLEGIKRGEIDTQFRRQKKPTVKAGGTLRTQVGMLDILAVERIEGTFERAGESRLTIRGRLDIHGSPHPIEVPAEVTARDGRIAARLAFTVPYVAWGMKDPSKLLLSVAKEVRVTVEAEGTLE